MRLLLLGLLIAAMSGCYTVRIETIPDVPGERLGPTAAIVLPPETAAYVYDVHSVAAGAANRWRIEVGQALGQYAEAYLRPLFSEGDDLRITLTIERFDVHDFEAHIDVRCAVSRGDDTVLDHEYHGAGIGHFAQTAWGGAFAMKSSMRKTTDEALRNLFEQIRTDLEKEYAPSASAGS